MQALNTQDAYRPIPAGPHQLQWSDWGDGNYHLHRVVVVRWLAFTLNLEHSSFGISSVSVRHSSSYQSTAVSTR